MPKFTNRSSRQTWVVVEVVSTTEQISELITFNSFIHFQIPQVSKRRLYQLGGYHLTSRPSTSYLPDYSSKTCKTKETDRRGHTGISLPKAQSKSLKSYNSKFWSKPWFCLQSAPSSNTLKLIQLLSSHHQTSGTPSLPQSLHTCQLSIPKLMFQTT